MLKIASTNNKPDWILIYLVDEEELELLLFRNGTHSDLF